MRFCQCDDTDSVKKTNTSLKSKMYVRKAIPATLHVKVIDLVINSVIISMTQILKNIEYHNYTSNF